MGCNNQLKAELSPRVEVNSREEETSLEKQQKGVEEADMMTRCRLHRMVPERVHDCPREVVSVVLSCKMNQFL